MQENNDHSASELWFSKREIEKLEEKLVKNKEDYNNHISRLKDHHHLETQTALLENQLKHQKTVERLNEKTAEMQKEYNEKLKELLFNKENNHQEEKKNDHRDDSIN